MKRLTVLKLTVESDRKSFTTEFAENTEKETNEAKRVRCR
jgi:hypothetical protein